MSSRQNFPTWGSGFLFCVLSAATAPALAQTETSPTAAHAAAQPIYVQGPVATAGGPVQHYILVPAPAPVSTQAAVPPVAPPVIQPAEKAPVAAPVEKAAVTPAAPTPTAQVAPAVPMMLVPATPAQVAAAPMAAAAPPAPQIAPAPPARNPAQTNETIIQPNPPPPAAAPAAIAEINPVKFGMEARFRYESTVDKDLVNATDFLSFRVRPSITYTVSPRTFVYVQPQYAKTAGLTAFVPQQAATPSNTAVETSANSNYAGDELRVHQAYLDFAIADNLRFTGGRQELNYGDGYLISPSSWFQFGRSFDAGKLRYLDGKSFIDVVHSKISTPANTNDNNGSDKSMSVLYASWNVNDMFKAIELYTFYISDDRQPTAPNGTSTIGATTAHASFGAHGLRAVTQFGQTAIKAEYNQNYGAEGTSYLASRDGAYMSVADITYSFEDSMKTKLSIELFQAGKNWREIYPTTHQTLGTSDVLGRRNVTGAAIHYIGDITEKWNLQADLFTFTRTSKDNPAYGTNSSTAVGAIANSDSNELGAELDMRVKYKIDKTLSIGVGMGIFQPGKYIKDNADAVTTTNTKDKTPSYSYVILETKM